MTSWRLARSMTADTINSKRSCGPRFSALMLDNVLRSAHGMVEAIRAHAGGVVPHLGSRVLIVAVMVVLGSLSSGPVATVLMGLAFVASYELVAAARAPSRRRYATTTAWSDR